MTTPTNRAKIRLVRGTYDNILASIADLVDGELCYAKDRNKLYMVEGTALTALDYLTLQDVTEAVQDVVGGVLNGGTGLTVTYDDEENTLVVDLDSTGVTAGDYGSATAIPVLTINEQGQITVASTASISTSLSISDSDEGTDSVALGVDTLQFAGGTGITSVVTDNTVTFGLDDTGVSADTYGDSTTVPVITVNDQGQITAVTTATVPTGLTVSADDENTDVVTVGTDTLNFAGGTGLSSTVSDNIVTFNLDNTTVTAGSYGSGTSVPVIEIDSQGRITSASTSAIPLGLTIKDDANTTDVVTVGTDTLTLAGGTGLSSVVADNIITFNLDNTAVTSGTYGDADSVAQISVDAQGRITAASDVNIAVTHNSITDFDSAVRETTGINQTFEPMGHAVRLDSAISFDASSRTFTIEPTDTSYDVWCKGVKFEKTTSETVTIPNTTGLYYIYFDSNGDLQYRTSYFDWDDDVPTSYIYWNATTGTAPYFADERHGIALDWATHEYLHRTRGAVIANGFSISNYTIEGDGTANADAQIDLSGGTFFDEDLEVQITHSNTPAANLWEQDLQGPAKLPVFYLNGSGPSWVKDTATEYPLKLGTARPQYNTLSGGSWSTVDASANRYLVNFVIATHNLNEPIIVVLGQDQYTNIGDAEAVDFSDLVLTDFPSVEFRPLYKLIFQCDSYTNVPKARLRSVIDIRQITSAGVGQGIGTDHGGLSGLGDDDHLQYLHATENRTGVSANISTSGTLKTTNTTAATNSSTGALVVAGGAGIGGDLYVAGNLSINGTTTTLSTETIVVEDSNIQLGTVETPTNVTAHLGGITLLGGAGGDKTIRWVSTTNAWTFSEHVDIANSKEYYIAGTSVLSATTLGSGVLASSLTSVGTIATGVWHGTTIERLYGGTGHTGYSDGQLLIGKTDGSLAKATITAGSNVTITNGDGSITIASTDTTYTAGDGLDLSGTQFSIDLKLNGGLVIESTELALDLGATSITGTLAVGDGGTGYTSYTDGQLLIGNTSTGGLSKATLSAGSNITITNGNGSIQISSDNTTYTAGNGITLVDTTFSAALKANGGIVIEGSNLAIDLGATSITGTLGVGDGGTGITSVSSGQVLIGSANNTLVAASLTAGSNVSITTGNGTISISSTDTTYTAGAGLDLSTTEFSLDLKLNGGLVIEATELALDLGASSITGTLGIADGGTGLTTIAQGSVLVSNNGTSLTSLDGGGSADKVLVYDSATDTVAWATDLDGGAY